MKERRRGAVRLLALLMAIMLLVPTISAAAAGGKEDRTAIDYSGQTEWPAGPEIIGEGGFLIELNSGAILYQKNADEQFYPASITKILTALVVIENCSLDEMVTFSYNAVHDLEEGAYSYIADTGDQLSVEDCLYAMLLQSSNEAAYALAEHCGGTVDGFAEKMNAKAKEVGATNSHFANPHGLFNENHYTTPHDMAMIMWAAIQNETFLTIDSTFSYRTAVTKTQPDGFYCQMRHAMMNTTSEYFNSSVVAGKTGYTQASKNTLVTYAVRDDMELVSVVMRSEANGQIYKDTQALLDYGFNSFAFQPISQNADLAAMEDQLGGIINRVVQNIEVTSEAKALLPKDSTGIDFAQEFSVDTDSLSGDEMQGSLLYRWGDMIMGRDPVLIRFVPEATSAAESENFANGSQAAETTPAPAKSGFSLETLTNLDVPMPVRILLVVILVILVIILIFQIVNLFSHRNRRRRRRKGRKSKTKRYY